MGPELAKNNFIFQVNPYSKPDLAFEIDVQNNLVIRWDII